MLPRIFIDLEGLQNVGQNFIVHLSALLRRVILYFGHPVFSFDLPGIPPTIFEAYPHARPSTDGEKEVMYKIGRYVFVVIAFRLGAFVEFEKLPTR